KNNEKILDASGGTGLFAERILNSKKIKEITILDVSKGMLNIAKKRLNNKKNVKFLLRDVHNLKLKSNYFSSVFSISAFHYYSGPEKVLSEFYRVLKKKGKLIIVDWSGDKFYFRVFDLIMRKINKSHIRNYKLSELKKLLIDKNFKIVKTVKWNYGLWSLMGVEAIKNEKI
ncbi:methyltransferase domain-containing protein, partial [Candidatus Pacearchaeota archaeon]|nr:methyltransferase domain-containing protein [Candidatus Pacearchaeota archaeon]